MCTQGLPSTATDTGKGKDLSDAPLHSPANSCHSDSFMSNASYPLTQPAQRQRRLNSTSNLRRARFNTPCFGLLSGASESSKPQANGITTSNTLSDTSGSPSSQHQDQGDVSSVEDDHVTVPVFAISEEEDRQPLVSAEPPEKPLRMNGQMFEGTKMPLLSSSVHPTSLARGGRGGALETQDPSALSCYLSASAMKFECDGHVTDSANRWSQQDWKLAAAPGVFRWNEAHIWCVTIYLGILKLFCYEYWHKWKHLLFFLLLYQHS